MCQTLRYAYLVGSKEDKMSSAPGMCHPSEKIASMIITLDDFNVAQAL